MMKGKTYENIMIIRGSKPFIYISLLYQMQDVNEEE